MEYYMCFMIFSVSVLFVEGQSDRTNPFLQNRKGRNFNSTNSGERATIQIRKFQNKPSWTTGKSYTFKPLPERMLYTTESTTTVKVNVPRTIYRIKPAEILEISSSDDTYYVSWPWRRRTQARWYISPIKSTTTSRPLEKLRKPKPTRPAMYSLNGFVPKPSLKFTATTEAPADILAWKVADLQALGSYTRRNKVKFYNDAVPDENIRRFGNKVTRTPNANKKSSPSRLRTNRRNGLAGLDFPAYDSIPLTTFTCGEKLFAGNYADAETQCQVWHMCPGGNSPVRHSFLCANGTVFNERRGICDWWYNVDC